MKLRAAALAMPMILAFAACTYQGATDPISRKFSWYDYVGGNDIRRACTPGAPDRYRFVYNAIYVEHVRTYDLQTRVGRPGENLLTARVIGQPGVASWDVGQPSDILGPWKGKTAQTWIRDSDVATLVASATETGLFGPAPTRLRLDSDAFYWTVAACRNGTFAFNAYQWPSDRFNALQFPKLLFAWDQTGIAVSPPRKADAMQIHGTNDPFREHKITFQLEVGENGLKGTQPLF